MSASYVRYAGDAPSRSLDRQTAHDQGRLLNDTVYNMQIGAAQLADDIGHYIGSYVLAFASHNTGRGRIKEWIVTGIPAIPRSI